jgi:hypothetical protein
MRAPFAASAAIQALGCVAWLALENFEYGFARYLAWAAVPVGSAVAAALATPPRLAKGTISALPAVVLFPVLNLVHEWLGRESEYSGLSGVAWIAVLTLPICLLLGLLGSSIGTAFAWLLSRVRRR